MAETTHLKRATRQQLVLDAAMRVFARGGYFGATTSQIADAAGISQGYVLHLFGTKEALFLAVLERAGDAIVEQMRSIQLEEFDLEHFDARYARTALDDTVMGVLLQGFATCSVPAVGTYVRELLSQMYEVLLEHTNATPEEARDYLARGLLVNTVLAMRFPEHLDEHPWAAPLLSVMLGDDEKLPSGTGGADAGAID
ncbi:TetR/AcrR family transcriptional regulator [Agromyces sp. NPDC055520]